jgi:hypothetical protein
MLRLLQQQQNGSTANSASNAIQAPKLKFRILHLFLRGTRWLASLSQKCAKSAAFAFQHFFPKSPHNPRKSAIFFFSNLKKFCKSSKIHYFFY